MCLCICKHARIHVHNIMYLIQLFIYILRSELFLKIIGFSKIKLIYFFIHDQLTWTTYSKSIYNWLLNFNTSYTWKCWNPRYNRMPVLYISLLTCLRLIQAILIKSQHRKRDAYILLTRAPATMEQQWLFYHS